MNYLKKKVKIKLAKKNNDETLEHNLNFIILNLLSCIELDLSSVVPSSSAWCGTVCIITVELLEG